MSNSKNNQLTHDQYKELLTILNDRFIKNMHRHKGMNWNKIQERLEGTSEKLW